MFTPKCFKYLAPSFLAGERREEGGWRYSFQINSNIFNIPLLAGKSREWVERIS